jgi:hypothetical protein
MVTYTPTTGPAVWHPTAATWIPVAPCPVFMSGTPSAVTTSAGAEAQCNVITLPARPWPYMALVSAFVGLVPTVATDAFQILLRRDGAGGPALAIVQHAALAAGQNTTFAIPSVWTQVAVNFATNVSLRLSRLAGTGTASTVSDPLQNSLRAVLFPLWPDQTVPT